jgi:hypothetical protein
VADQPDPGAGGTDVLIKQVGERPWLVTLMHFDLGYSDDDACRRPIANPFGPKVLPVRSPHASGMDQQGLAERVGFEPTVEFPLHTLSKRAPSTTRTSLRIFRISSLQACG